MLSFRSVDRGDAALIETVRTMFREYAQELGIDLCFQGFEEELIHLPGNYGPPGGCLLLGLVAGEAAACGALRDLGDDVCELKRIYVRPAFRGHGGGRTMSQELLRRAEQMGYRAARLDTLARLEPALALYRSLGFREIPPYNYNPEPDIVYFERPLPITPT